MVSNPNFYGQSTHGTPNQIEDGVDFPHTGIVKALSDGLGQNYAISGFDITIDSATQIDVGAGVIFRDGKRVAVSAVSNLTLSSTYTNGYHLLIASSASSPVLTIRNPTAADKVAQYTAGDTIIAVITHNGTANVGIQYLTVNKTENSLSIGRNDSGYTEMGTIACDANSIDITTTNSNADINLTPHGTGDVKAGTLAIDGDQTVGAGQDGYVLTYTHSNAKAALAALPASIANTVEDTTPQLGGDLDTNSQNIKFDTAHGILDDDGEEQLIFNKTTSAVNYVTITNSATGDRPQILATGDDTNVGLEIETKGTGAILLNSNVYLKKMQIGYGSGPGQMQVYNAGDNLQLNAAGDSNGNQVILELDAGTDGVETNRIASVTGHLEVSQEIRSKGYIRNITEVVGNAVGPPPVILYDLLITDDIIIAKAPSGTPPNDLVLNLPDAEATDIGRTYRIIASDVTASLQLNRTGTDDAIENPSGATLSLPYSLAAGKIYDITCIEADRWMLMQLN